MGRVGAFVTCVVSLPAALVPVVAQAADKDSFSTWSGISAGPDSVYSYAGAAFAFSGDLDAEGLLARIGLGTGQYTTDGNDPQDVTQYGADLMLGYRFLMDGNSIALYGGADYNQHDNVDPDAEIAGAEIGAKALIEVYMPLDGIGYASAFAQYSTAFDTFNASAKFAYRLTGDLTIGPEAGTLGTQGFDQFRTGLASAYWITGDTELALSAGYAWAMDKHDDGGIYAGINVYSRF